MVLYRRESVAYNEAYNETLADTSTLEIASPYAYHMHANTKRSETCLEVDTTYVTYHITP